MVSGNTITCKKNNNITHTSFKVYSDRKSWIVKWYLRNDCQMEKLCVPPVKPLMSIQKYNKKRGVLRSVLLLFDQVQSVSFLAGQLQSIIGYQDSWFYTLLYIALPCMKPNNVLDLSMPQIKAKSTEKKHMSIWMATNHLVPVLEMEAEATLMRDKCQPLSRPNTCLWYTITYRMSI